jgi:hypothetical protein
MALAFPTPTGPGDSFVASNGYTYRWDGYKWNTIIGGTTSLLKLYQTEEAIAVLTSATSVVSHSCLTQNIFYHDNITSNFIVDLVDFTLDPLYGTAITIIMDQGDPAYNITEVRLNGTTSTVYWTSGAFPEGNPLSKDVISLSIINKAVTTGTNYLVFGQQITFG